jgi:AcrR family transcriptional regulator
MGIIERKQREKEARVTQIKNVAAQLFQRKGFEDTTIDEIAQYCELSKASIYSYFKSKDDLFFSILEPEMNHFAKHIGQMANKTDEPADKTIIKVFMESFKNYVKNPEVYQLLWRTNLNLLPENKLTRLETILSTNVSNLEKIVKKGIDQGVFNEVNVKVTSLILWGLYMGVFHQQASRVASGRSDYRKSTLMAAVKLILGGLKKK